ncbi:MAG: J domain-containing protein [Candidatus Limnocylindrus sp.]
MRAGEAWQVLGLPPAPTAERVKQAYRNLAKSLHPDAAGGRSKPAAFARLTEAYEVALAEALAANRHGAPATRAAAPQRPRPRRAATPQASSPGQDAERPRARPGSTTYDGTSASDQDQVWNGAEWVGADSGTYWRVNPKEYADPRKHGAEYRARGKRPIRRDGRTSRTPFAAAAEREVQGAVAEWPRVEWRLFYALVAWAPLLAAEPLLPGIAVELLLFGLLVLAPRVAWSAARGSVALLLIALPWSLAAAFGLPLPSTEGVGLFAWLIWAGTYAVAALLSWSGRLSPQPWLVHDEGPAHDAG